MCEIPIQPYLGVTSLKISTNICKESPHSHDQRELHSRLFIRSFSYLTTKAILYSTTILIELIISFLVIWSVEVIFVILVLFSCFDFKIIIGQLDNWKQVSS